jgi:carbon-monoxide dehydrogenase medium subunit
MKPPPFRYVRAGSLEDALSALASEGDEARLLAGGQSLIAMMNLRLVKPSALVDVNGVSELDYIRADDGTLTVGALTRLSTAEVSQEVAGACPLMSEAIRHIAHRPIRNRGTVGGNLSHADPSSELPAVALAVDARMVVQRNGSVRRVAADDFFVGALATSMEPDEALTAIEVPRGPDGQGWSFMEISPRKGDYALVGVAVTLSVDNGRCSACRVVYTGNGDRARRIPEAESAVVGEAAGAATFSAAGEAAGRHIEPNSDLHASEQYRRDIAAVLTRRALEQAAARCRQEG